MASTSHRLQFRKVNSWVLLWFIFLITEGMLKTCLLYSAEWQEHCERLNIKFECTEPCGRILCKEKCVRHHVKHVCHPCFFCFWVALVTNLHWFQWVRNNLLAVQVVLMEFKLLSLLRNFGKKNLLEVERCQGRILNFFWWYFVSSGWSLLFKILSNEH